MSTTFQLFERWKHIAQEAAEAATVLATLQQDERALRMELAHIIRCEPSRSLIHCDDVWIVDGKPHEPALRATPRPRESFSVPSVHAAPDDCGDEAREATAADIAHAQSWAKINSPDEVLRRSALQSTAIEKGSL